MLTSINVFGIHLRRLIIQSVKLPLIYLLIGTVLLAISFANRVATGPEWQRFFDLTDKLGSIFIVLALITFIYKFIVLLCTHLETRLLEKHLISAMILTSFRKALRLIFILIALNVIIMLLSPSQFYEMIVNRIITTIIIGSIGWITIQIIYTVEAVLHQHMLTLERADNVRVKELYTKMHILRNVLTVVIIVITIAAILMSFNSVRNVGISLLASAGFLTAIIGLSAQKTLVSIFSGLQLALSQVIKIGDIVVIESISGMIEEITFTFVTLRLADRRRLIVPINFFIEKSFENWSREPDSLHSSINFYVDYMLPIKAIRSELDNILKKSTYWDGKANKVQVSNITASSVEVRIKVSAANSDDLSELRAEVREKMLEFIRDKFPDHFPKMRFNGQTPTT